MHITSLDCSHHPEFDSHEEIIEFKCSETGLHALIAIHNKNLGPALGGCRFYPYASSDAALTDVLRLSKGMTYKSALAGLKLGGGKSVIIGNPKSARHKNFMQRFGEAVETLGGRYITAEDVGTTDSDMVEISKSTNHVAGLPADGDARHVRGNPSPITALGTFYGLKAAVKFKLGRENLDGIHIAIQGLGAVGRALAELCLKEGCVLSIADINQKNLEEFASAHKGLVTIIDTAEILKTKCDVLAPCAMGAILNDETIPALQTKIIAGAANNQLARTEHDQLLFEKGILYAPDYAINSGGVTSVGYEYFERMNLNPYDYALTFEAMLNHVRGIEKTMLEIFEFAHEQHIPTGVAANQMALKIFSAR